MTFVVRCRVTFFKAVLCICLILRLYGVSSKWSILWNNQKYTGHSVCYTPVWILKTNVGFPGGVVVENLPANAGDTGLSPGLGRSHMPRSNWACAPQLLSLRVWSLCSATREATIVRGLRTAMKSDPHLPQLEKALTQKRRPNTA